MPSLRIVEAPAQCPISHGGSDGRRNAHDRLPIEDKVHLPKSFFLAPDDWKGFRPDPHDFRSVNQDLTPNIDQNVKKGNRHGRSNLRPRFLNDTAAVAHR